MKISTTNNIANINCIQAPPPIVDNPTITSFIADLQKNETDNPDEKTDHSGVDSDLEENTEDFTQGLKGKQSEFLWN